MGAHRLVRDGAENTPLFEPVDLELHAGERLALRGPSGSGKTLVLRSLTLLDSPSAGEILWRGDPIADADVPAHRRRVHLLVQTAPLLAGDVADNLALPFRLAISETDFDGGRARALLQRFGSGALFERDTADLSGGERQMIALVRALLLDPLVLLLDEPTTALDPERTEVAETLIDEWHQADPQRASIWVSHDAEQLARLTRSSVTIVKKAS